MYMRGGLLPLGGGGGGGGRVAEHAQRTSTRGYRLPMYIQLSCQVGGYGERGNRRPGGRSAHDNLLRARKTVKEMHNLNRKSRATCADPAHTPVRFDAVHCSCAR